MENGSEKVRGVRCTPYDYTGKEILSIKHYEQKINEEIQRVKDLKSDTHTSWVLDARKADHRKWEMDPVSYLKGIGIKTTQSLKEQEIHTIKDLRDLTEDEMTLLATHTGISHHKLTKIKQNEAAQALSGSTTLTKVDYRKAKNPYEAKYGQQWRQMIKNVSSMRRYVSIKDLVTHIDSATREIFRGTVNHDTYMWSHDALTQLMDNECQQWMKEKGFLDKWIVPVLGCNSKITITKPDNTTATSTRYSQRPPGNSPEIMPNDNSLNRDLKCSHDLSVSLTNHLPMSDPRKFSKYTPKAISRGILKIFDPVSGCSPRPDRIVQDIKRIPEALAEIVKVGGGIVPGLADRNGIRRNTRTGCHYTPPREEPTSKTMEEMGLHKEVFEVAKKLIETEREKFATNQMEEDLCHINST